jgi:hypothetical protein
MPKRTYRLVLILLFLIAGKRVSAQPPLVTVFEYIDTYSGVAVEQMAQYRIPASVILAQAIFESGSGTSELARKSNNHFGIKCHAQWIGDTAIKTDDIENECFRKYNSIIESFADHSRFLSSRKRYAHLFKLPLTDYHAWCHGIKRSGYATLPAYAEELIRIIERYQLYRLDRVNYLYPVQISFQPPQLKSSPFDAALKPLSSFAHNSLLWLNEEDYHLRSLDMILHENPEQEQLLAEKKDGAKKF